MISASIATAFDSIWLFSILILHSVHEFLLTEHGEEQNDGNAAATSIEVKEVVIAIRITSEEDSLQDDGYDSADASVAKR